MSRVVPLMLTLALLVTACASGSDDDASPASAPATSASTTAPEPETTIAADTTTTSSVAPNTTIDEASLLADAEAAYLEAFEVGKEVIRNPDDPTNEERLRASYTDEGITDALENLRRAQAGDFYSVETPGNESFAIVIENADFINGDSSLVRLTACEFNSDRIFERGSAPSGGDTLIRDDPASILFVVRMQLVDGSWKVHAGTRGEEIRSEAERCTSES